MRIIDMKIMVTVQSTTLWSTKVVFSDGFCTVSWEECDGWSEGHGHKRGAASLPISAERRMCPMHCRTKGRRACSQGGCSSCCTGKKRAMKILELAFHGSCDRCSTVR